MTGRPANCDTALSHCSPTLACRLSRSLAWLDTAGSQPPRPSTESRSGRSSCTVLMSWTGSSQAGPTRMLSYSLSYSAPAASRSAVGCKPCDLVGVAGFEPAASSSRTQAGCAGHTLAPRLSSQFTSQCDSVRLAAIRALDAPLTHGCNWAALT